MDALFEEWVVSVDGSDGWLNAVGVQESGSNLSNAGFYQGVRDRERIQLGVEHLAFGGMEGDEIPFESEVLYLSKLTGWTPQEIEAMPAVYFDNLGEAWNTINKARPGK